MIRCGYLVFLFSFLTTISYCQPFPCDGDLLLSFNQDVPNNSTYKVDFGPFGTLLYSPFRSYFGGQFEALGFNPTDNYIYGISQNSNDIVRLNANQTYDVIGQLPLIHGTNISAGDCAPTGEYLCISNETNQLLAFNVVNTVELISEIELFWNPEAINSGPFVAKFGDFAIDPINPNIAFGYVGNYGDPDLGPLASRGFLYSINVDLNDPNVGMVTAVGKLPSTEVRKIGSLFFTSEGALYGYGSISTDNQLIQNTLVQIDKNSGSSFVFPWRGPISLSTDGCSCPYNFTFECAADPLIANCTESQVNYYMSINNRFFQDLSDIHFIDSLPDGMIIANITGNFVGDIVPGTGVGTSILEIENLQVPGRQITLSLIHI